MTSEKTKLKTIMRKRDFGTRIIKKRINIRC